MSEKNGVGRPTEPHEQDQAVIQMLDLLQADIRHSPERLRPLSSALINFITSLVGHLDVDLNAPLLADDE